MAWPINPRPAKSLIVLRDELLAAFPKIPKSAYGLIGDANHKPPSDHLPNSEGVVRALDVPHDPKNGLDCNQIAEILRSSRRPWIGYVIFNGRVFDPGGGYGWEWYPFGGDPHKNHLHLSVEGDYDNKSPWGIGGKVKDFNQGDIVNVAKATGVDPKLVASKRDWNDVYYSTIQPVIIKLKAENDRLRKSDSISESIKDVAKAIRETNK